MICDGGVSDVRETASKVRWVLCAEVLFKVRAISTKLTKALDPRIPLPWSPPAFRVAPRLRSCPHQISRQQWLCHRVGRRTKPRGGSPVGSDLLGGEFLLSNRGIRPREPEKIGLGRHLISRRRNILSQEGRFFSIEENYYTLCERVRGG